MTTVANVLVTMALGPFMTALGARVFIGHRIPARTWVAITLASIGIAWMYGGQMDLASQLAGTLVALMVPLAGACNWTVVQHGGAHGQKIDLVPAVLMRAGGAVRRGAQGARGGPAGLA
jgi:drug/metabolite transporter (DMT)-like permease